MRSLRTGGDKKQTRYPPQAEERFRTPKCRSCITCEKNGSKDPPLQKLLEGAGELFDGCEEGVGLGGAKAFFGGERAEDGDRGANAGAAGHFEVFGSVADVDGMLRAEAHAAESELQGSGMGFALLGVAAADACGENVPEVEILELAMDAVAITAGDEAQRVAIADACEDAASAGNELGILLGIVFAPDVVGGGPFVLGKSRGAIDAIPIGRIVLFEFGEAPGNAHGAKHGEIGGSIGGVGIEKSAVPIEEDAAKG